MILALVEADLNISSAVAVSRKNNYKDRVLYKKRKTVSFDFKCQADRGFINLIKEYECLCFRA